MTGVDHGSIREAEELFTNRLNDRLEAAVRASSSSGTSREQRVAGEQHRLILDALSQEARGTGGVAGLTWLTLVPRPGVGADRAEDFGEFFGDFWVGSDALTVDVHRGLPVLTGGGDEFLPRPPGDGLEPLGDR